jgi:hypothetical protein
LVLILINLKLIYIGQGLGPLIFSLIFFEIVNPENLNVEKADVIKINKKYKKLTKNAKN